MTAQPLLSATLIAKDEKHNIKRCFDALWESCDQIVLLDTGSTDGTVSEAKRYAASKGAPKKLTVARFAWNDNFAAARQAADQLATGQWVVWADLDDEIHGLDHLRRMAADATPDVRAFFCRYRYATDPDGNSISELWRERVVRNDGTPWTGRLHEHKLFTGGGQIVRVDPSIAEWIHHRDHTQRTGARNLAILEKWLADEPDNPRVLHSIAMEYMGDDRHREAADMFAAYLQHPGEETDRRCQAARYQAVMLMVLGQIDEASTVAMRALEWNWSWPDTHLTLAEAAHAAGDPQRSIMHADMVIRLGVPETLLIINPLQYTAQPTALIAIALGQLGKHKEAVEYCERALSFAAHYPLAAQQFPRLRATWHREQTLETFVSCVELLVEYGEPIKALATLENVPWFVAQRPELKQLRTRVTRLLEERQSNPVALPVDEAADAFVARHLESA